MKPISRLATILGLVGGLWGNPFAGTSGMPTSTRPRARAPHHRKVSTPDAKRLASIKKWNDEVEAKNADKKALQKSRKDARNQAKNGLKRSN